MTCGLCPPWNQISRLGSLAEEAAKRKLRKQAGEFENAGVGGNKPGSDSKDLGKHEKDKKRHDSGFLEELDELYARHKDKEPSGDTNDRQTESSQGEMVYALDVCPVGWRHPKTLSSRINPF